MRIQLLIAATLATLPACTGPCKPIPEEMFSIEKVLIEGDVDLILDRFAIEDRSEIDCEIACEYLYQKRTDWNVRSIDTCTFSLTPTAAEARETEVGSIECEGVGFEYYCDGRRPLGHIEAGITEGSLAASLARSAHLEAASVVAFEELAAVLSASGAPAELVARCREAAEDERRHAALVGAHAASRGATPPPAKQHPRLPTLAALAIDNAREGCVLEAWAALRAAWLAKNARDPDLRALYTELAADEAAHAQLSWDLHEWLSAHVDPSSRETAAARLVHALRDLPRIARHQACTSPPALTMPVEVATTLAERFAAGLGARVASSEGLAEDQPL